MEGLACYEFHPNLLHADFLMKTGLFGKAYGLFTAICSAVLQTGTPAPAKQLSCACWLWVQPSESRELTLVPKPAELGKLLGIIFHHSASSVGFI